MLVMEKKKKEKHLIDLSKSNCYSQVTRSVDFQNGKLVPIFSGDRYLSTLIWGEKKKSSAINKAFDGQCLAMQD